MRHVGEALRECGQARAALGYLADGLDIVCAALLGGAGGVVTTLTESAAKDRQAKGNT